MNAMNMAKLLYTTKGFKSFYSGFYPTVLRAFPANASLLFGVELANKILDKKD